MWDVVCGVWHMWSARVDEVHGMGNGCIGMI